MCRSKERKWLHAKEIHLCVFVQESEYEDERVNLYWWLIWEMQNKVLYLTFESHIIKPNTVGSLSLGARIHTSPAKGVFYQVISPASLCVTYKLILINAMSITRSSLITPLCPSLYQTHVFFSQYHPLPPAGRRTRARICWQACFSISTLLKMPGDRCCDGVLT